MPTQKYDVFISHNSKDKPVVEKIVNHLRSEAKLTVWFDKPDMVAGEDFERQTQEALSRCQACAIFVGERGWGPNHLLEAQTAVEIRQNQPNRLRVIPVLLPGAVPEVFQDIGLSKREIYVDLRRGIEDTDEFRLLWRAIYGKGRGFDPLLEIAADARKWNRQNRNSNFLYQGKILDEALSLAKQHQDQTTKLIWDFIKAGVALRNSYRLRLTTGLILGLIVLSGLSAFGLIQSKNRVAQQATAQVEATLRAFAQATARAENQVNLAQELADESGELLTGSAPSIDLSVLLAIESLRHNPNQKATEALLDGASLLPPLQSELPHSTEPWENTIVGDHYASYGRGAAVFSPDGRWVATINKETATLWNAATMQTAIRLIHENQINSVVFDATSQWILTASTDKTARIWDIASGREIARLALEDEVGVAIFSDDRKWIVTVSNKEEDELGLGQILKVWETNSLQEVFELNEGEYSVTSVAFSPNGEQFAMVSSNSIDIGALSVWETETWTKQQEIQPISAAGWIGFSPSGKKILANATLVGNAQFTRYPVLIDTASFNDLASTFDSSIDGHWMGQQVISSDEKVGLVVADRKNYAIAVDLETGKEVFTLRHDNLLNSASLSPDGTRAVTASQDGTAKIWDLTTGKEIARLPHQSSVTWAVFSPDGSRVLTVSGDTVRVWGAEASLTQVQLRHQALSRPVLSPDGIWLATIDKNIVWLSDIVNHTVSQLNHDSEVQSIVFSADSRSILTATQPPVQLRAWQVADGSGENLALATTIQTATFSPDGRWIIISPDCGLFILCESEIWELSTRQRISQVQQDWLTSFSADGSTLATATSYGLSFPYEIYVFDPTMGKQLAVLQDREYVHLLQLSPDGKYVLVASAGLMNSGENGVAQIWDVANQNVVSSFVYLGGINSASFSPDGKLVVTGSSSRIASVWETSSGRERFQLAHNDEVKDASFSSDGKWIVTASVDGTARVWGASTGQSYLRLFHDDGLQYAIFSPNNRWILTVSADGFARLLPWQINDLIEHACERLDRNLTPEEWQIYLPDEPYRTTCPAIP